MLAGLRRRVSLRSHFWVLRTDSRMNQRESWVKSEHWQRERQERKEVLILILPLCSPRSTFHRVPADAEPAAGSLWSAGIDGSIDRIWVTDLQPLPAGSGARGAGPNIRAEAAAHRQSDIRAPSIRNRLKGFISKISNLYPRIRSRADRKSRHSGVSERAEGEWQRHHFMGNRPFCAARLHHSFSSCLSRSKYLFSFGDVQRL